MRGNFPAAGGALPSAQAEAWTSHPLRHEALTGGGDQRDRLGKENAHRVAEGECLLVDRAGDRDLTEGGLRQLHGGPERQRRELLALGVLDPVGLLLGELPEPLEEILGITAERKEPSTFHITTPAAAPPVAPPLPVSGTR